jgi:hypothetical protein
MPIASAVHFKTLRDLAIVVGTPAFSWIGPALREPICTPPHIAARTSMVAFQPWKASVLSGTVSARACSEAGWPLQLDLAVAVFTQDIGVRVSGVDPAVLAEREPESGAVEDGPGADDALPRPAQMLQGHTGEGVHWIGHHDQDGVVGMLGNLRANALDNVGILPDELRSWLAWRLLGSSRDHDQVCIGAVPITAGHDGYGANEWQSVRKAHDFALDSLGVDVNQRRLAGQTALEQGVDVRCSDGSGADENDSSIGTDQDASC